MMYGMSARQPIKRGAAVNERMRVSTRVRLPGGDVDMETALPIERREFVKRNLRSTRHLQKDARPAQEMEAEPKKAAVNLTGISLRTLFTATAMVAVVLSMMLLLDLSAMMEKGKEVNAITASVEKASEQIEQLRVDLAMATRETDIAYSASKRLGLIAGKGAQTVYIQVPAKYQTSDQFPLSSDAPPVQNGAYAALSGYMD